MTAPPSPEPLLDLFLADVKILAVKTALQLGVFDRRTLNIPDTGWNPDGARRLLDALVALRLLAKEDDSYRPTLLALQYLSNFGTCEKLSRYAHENWPICPMRESCFVVLPSSKNC